MEIVEHDTDRSGRGERIQEACHSAEETLLFVR
jgi:hypothetical protein